MPNTKQADIPNDLPIDNLRARICEALKTLMPDASYPALSIEELFPDRVILEDLQGALWQYPYTVTAEGIVFGERSAVKVEYVAARQASASAADIRLLQAIDKEGWEWDVLVLKAGLGANRQYFPADTLRQCAGVFEGARVFCLDDAQHSRSGDKSAKQIVGWIDQASYREESVKGRLHLLTGADWLRQNLMDSHAKGKPDLYGLSVDAPGKATTRQIQQAGESLTVQWFTEIKSPATVDVVWNPGTTGGFQRALNAISAERAPTQEERMKEQLLKILQAKRPDLYGLIDPATATEEHVLALLNHAVPTPATQTAVQQAAPALSDADRAVIRQAQVTMWNGQVKDLLGESKLPEVMQASLRKRFFDVPGDVEMVKQAITTERETFAALSQSGKVHGLGYTHDALVEGEAERIQASMDKLFGVEVKSDAPSFASLRQAYVKITGDVELAGRPPVGREQHAERMTQAVQSYWRNGIGDPGYEQPGFVRIEQSQNAAAWPTILGNSLYRRLTKDYAAVDYGENRIISMRRRATDFRTLEAQRLQYAADLPTVNPEVADYTEAGQLGEEAVSYAVSTRGRLMTVTRKTIINDDLGAVIRLPQREGRAARRTFARFVWNLFINNATYDADATAWFHANHANLGSTALTANAAGITELMAAAQQLMDMTEPGSGEKLGGAYWAAKLLLVVPTTLAGTAKQINQSKGIPGAANQGDNPAYGMFGSEDNPERIFVNPLFTDANDWGLFRDPSDMDIIEAAFLNGQETPEVFIADQQNVGQMFFADKLQYKIRFEFGAELLDFRGGRKAVV